MTLPLSGVPVKIGDRTVRLGFWGMPRNPDEPRRTAGTFTLVDGEGDVVLDVFIGPKGDPGEPMAPWKIEWDSTITDPGDLPDVATLGEDDDGRAWVIGTTLYVYVDALGADGEYRSIDAGIQGPPGLTPDLDITAELVEAADPDDPYGEVEVVPSGTSTSPNFHLKVPGLRGPVGPSTTIRLAPDYDNTNPPLDGQGVVWDETLGKFKPGDLSPFAAKMYTIPHENFVAYSGSAGRQLIGSLDIEAQDVAWYPDVAGSIRITRNILSSAAVEVEIRIGDTGAGTGETEPLCGLGPYDPQWALLDATAVAHIHPHFSDTGNPVRAVSPDTAEGRVPAGQAKTIYVFLHKIGGSGTYSFAKNPADQLRINLLPVS